MIDFEQILALKDQLSRRLVGPMETNFIHGIAVGIMERADDYCLRLYVSKMIDRREFDAIVRPTIIPKEIIVEIIFKSMCRNF